MKKQCSDEFKKAFMDHRNREYSSYSKATDLMVYLVKLVCPPSGLLLDPFFGSGSTGVAASSLGRGFCGIEREAQYVEIARNRLQQRNPLLLAAGDA